MYRQSRPRSRDYLLFLRPSKLPKDCLCYRGWRLNRQGVHEHARGGRHLAVACPSRMLARSLSLQVVSGTSSYGSPNGLLSLRVPNFCVMGALQGEYLFGFELCRAKALVLPSSGLELV